MLRQERYRDDVSPGSQAEEGSFFVMEAELRRLGTWLIFVTQECVDIEQLPWTSSAKPRKPG